MKLSRNDAAVWAIWGLFALTVAGLAVYDLFWVGKPALELSKAESCLAAGGVALFDVNGKSMGCLQ
jgi:hypothetical protein